MTAEESSTEPVPTDEAAPPSYEGHPLPGWIVAAVFLVATLYMVFVEPWPTIAAEWFYAIMFGAATVIAAGYALREHGYLRL